MVLQVFEDPPCCFPERFPVRIPIDCTPGSLSSTSSPAPVVFLMMAIRTGVRGELLEALICVSLVIRDVGVSVGHMHVVVGEVSVQVLCPCFNYFFPVKFYSRLGTCVGVGQPCRRGSFERTDAVGSSRTPRLRAGGTKDSPSSALLPPRVTPWLTAGAQSFRNRLTSQGHSQCEVL